MPSKTISKEKKPSKKAPAKKKSDAAKPSAAVKPPAKEKPKERKTATGTPKKTGYSEAIGRRKTSGARVRIFSGDGAIQVNGVDFREYFPTEEMQKIVLSPLKKHKLEENFSATIKVSGGGIHSQAEAVRHGIARALVKVDAEFRKKLKRAGFLKRDPRVKERRKFGLKKARKAPQWSKR